MRSGAAIISSVSYPFAKIAEQAYGEEYLNFMCQAKLVEEKRVNYWKQEVGNVDVNAVRGRVDCPMA